MALDPQVQQLLEMMAALPGPPFYELTPQEARAAMDAPNPLAQLPSPPLKQVEDRTIPGPHGDVPLRIYWPEGAGAENPLPVMVYYHGGGWVLGTLDGFDDLCRYIAAQAGIIVISVDYRLAPEHKFPAAYDDALAAARWALANAAALGADAARLGLGGDSAGANLAAAVSQTLADDASGPAAFQVLINPALDRLTHYDSIDRNGDGYLLTKAAVRWFEGHYLNTEDERADPRFSPALAGNLAALPRTLIYAAEFDPLVDEATAYASKLRAAGVEVKCTVYEGMIHTFINLAGFLSAGKAALDELVTDIREEVSS